MARMAGPSALREVNLRSVRKVRLLARNRSHSRNERTPTCLVAFNMTSDRNASGGGTPISFPRRIQLLSAVWISCILAGMVSVLNYSSAPGAAAKPPRSWPTTAKLSPHPSRPTLIMFVHPHCPCSMASINELSRLAARTRDRLEIIAIFVIPPGCPPNWHHSALWDSARSIPGVRAVADEDARICSQFHVTTSGHCLVYNPQNSLIFSGGITAGRGHEGDSTGQTMISDCVREFKEEGLSECATFGCQLTTDQSK